ncbi:multidrug resistance protein YpnP [Thermoclostridium stercorarium subsp. stercorarium DSM 8532]|uniref:Probable multidrug resistance protein NorM n=1 Tax=Thermoclostridium stercorarium (strain ATCC 35414 / DSM 8532 / NCIMB 11754) TaxID=1121335 RepID=L7VJI9_THES1|nr:MATE family efflux transporter [Thermoclostridium stercorarium]AGC68250.1 multidrug resistance protein YpnP [Thermoclostridium stercorarium subsp. stercorarium DSM 8532]AGI39277.1 efflux protein [Thermoclostridium stercorarium subsp. stercorarium DSM 8532]
MANKGKDKDLTKGSILGGLIEFSVPLLLGLIFQQLYNTVDTLVVGNFVGKEALAAVGSTTPIINTLIGIFTGFSMGANVIVSQYYGANDEKSVHDAVHTSIIMSFFFSIIITVIGIASAPIMLNLMDTPDDVIHEASVYLEIYFAGATGLVFYNMGSGILRAVGDSKRPLYFLIFSAVANTVLDLVFVINFKMGVAGVAWATVISQVLSAILVLIVLSRTSGPYRIYWNKLKLNKPMLESIIKIGLPSSVQQGITAFSNVFVQGYINKFGSAFMAGYSAYGKIDAIALLPMQAIAMGCTTFVGQNIGAGKIKRAKKGINISLILSMVFTVILLIPLIIFAEQAIMLFNSEPDVIYYGTLYMRFVSPFYLLSCINQVYAGALRGSGDTRAPMIIMLSSFVAFRQIYLYVVSNIFRDNFYPILFAYPAGWLVCSILLVIYYHKSNWEHKRIIIKNNNVTEEN